MNSTTTSRVWKSVILPAAILLAASAVCWIYGFHKTAIIGGSFIAVKFVVMTLAATAAPSNSSRCLSPDEIDTSLQIGLLTQAGVRGDWRENNPL